MWWSIISTTAVLADLRSGQCVCVCVQLCCRHILSCFPAREINLELATQRPFTEHVWTVKAWHNKRMIHLSTFGENPNRAFQNLSSNPGSQLFSLIEIYLHKPPVCLWGKHLPQTLSPSYWVSCSCRLMNTQWSQIFICLAEAPLPACRGFSPHNRTVRIKTVTWIIFPRSLAWKLFLMVENLCRSVLQLWFHCVTCSTRQCEHQESCVFSPVLGVTDETGC